MSLDRVQEVVQALAGAAALLRQPLAVAAPGGMVGLVGGWVGGLGRSGREWGGWPGRRGQGGVGGGQSGPDGGCCGGPSRGAVPVVLGWRWGGAADRMPH